MPCLKLRRDFVEKLKLSLILQPVLDELLSILKKQN